MAMIRSETPGFINVDTPFEEWNPTRVIRSEIMGYWGHNADLKAFDDENIPVDPAYGNLIDERSNSPFRKDWKVTPGGLKPADLVASALITQVCNLIDFDKICSQLNYAIFTGRKLALIHWKLDKISITPKKQTFIKEFWIPEKITTLDENRLVFLRPEHSQVDGSIMLHERCEARWLTDTQPDEGIAFPINSIIIHSHGALKGSPYGRGVFERLWWLSKFKKQVLKFGLPALDAKALPYISYEEGMVSDTDLTKAKEALTNFYKLGWATFPASITVDFLERFHQGRLDSIQAFLNWCDEQAATAILGQTLTSKTQDNADRGNTQIHYQVGEDRAKRDADLLALNLKEYLWKPLVNINVMGAAVPSVYRNFEPVITTIQQAQIDSEVAKQGYRRTLESITEIYGEGFELAPEPKISSNSPESENSKSKVKPKT